MFQRKACLTHNLWPKTLQITGENAPWQKSLDNERHDTRRRAKNHFFDSMQTTFSRVSCLMYDSSKTKAPKTLQKSIEIACRVLFGSPYNDKNINMKLYKKWKKLRPERKKVRDVPREMQVLMFQPTGKNIWKTAVLAQNSENTVNCDKIKHFHMIIYVKNHVFRQHASKIVTRNVFNVL